MIKRFDRIDIVSSDLAEAGRIYHDNFGFTVSSGPNPNEVAIKIGGAEIRLRSNIASAEVSAANTEGLAALWLEADNVEAVAAKLSESGVPHSAIRHEESRRIIAVEAAAANQVPLFIFDRRA
ncbi:MAG: VOC family protein [Candidatus Binataceae bacterium]